MNNRSNIYLVGLMGAGKTTIGRQLARRLGRRFYDSDHEIVARTGVPIPTIFEIEGEAGFRKRETQMMDELTQVPDIVIATGGGVVLAPANRELMHARGIVIYLNVSPQILFERTRHDRNRPLLQVEDPLARVRELHAVRHPLYAQIAHFTIDTGRPSVSTLVNMIVMQLELAGTLPRPAPR